MGGYADHLRDICRSMNVGEAVTFDRTALNEAFPVSMWSDFFERGSSVDQLLGGLIGSAWIYRTHEDPMTGDITIHRVAETGKRWNVDPDRRHWFRQMEDGSYEPNGRRAPISLDTEEG